MTIDPNVSFGATNLDADDKRAALLAITRENARRTENRLVLPLLPAGTAAEVRQSYITYMKQWLIAMHLNLIGEAKSVSSVKETGWTAAELDTVHALMVDRLNAGESKAAILADFAS